MREARTSILNAALELFAKKGYAGSSIREICQSAGITKPVLYYHFRSKEHLYQELMLDLFTKTRKNLLRLSSLKGSLRNRLVLYVSSEFRNSKRDPNGVRLLFRMMFSPEGEYPHFNFVQEFQRERMMVAGFIKDANKPDSVQDAELLSIALMGVILMEILEFFFTGRPTLTRRKAEKLVDLLLPSSSPANSAIPVGIAGGVRL